MQIYLVGGAVRDAWLGFPSKDRDYVVVGQTPEAMLARGFKAVGKDFPVFLHPESGEEYALARTERKTGPGYRGFAVVADPTITLEQDLLRRDLTINAIAQDASGQHIDPLGGLRDLEQRVLRHASPAFEEDPLRVLRVARFAARYHHLGFTVAPETKTLMARMVAAGQVDELTTERVWGELSKALAGPNPQVFLQVLRECGALARVLPEVNALYGVPQVEEHHPEIDTGVHTEMVLAQAARLAPGRLDIAFAALVHDLGKGLTAPELWPRHIDHELAGVPPVEQVCDRLRVPTAVRELALAVCEHHLTAHRCLESRPRTFLKLFDALGAFRRPARLEAFVLACEADARGRKGLEDRQYPQADLLRRAFAAAASVTAQSALDRGLTGPAIGEAMRRDRLRAITQVRPQSARKAARRGAMC